MDSSNSIQNPILPNSFQALTGQSFLEKFINLAINLLLLIGSLIFFFLIISGGIKWLLSGGDKTKLESAQKQLTHAVIGLAILLFSFAILKLIEGLFRIDLLKINIPTL